MDSPNENTAKKSEWIALDAFVHALETKFDIQTNHLEYEKLIGDPPDFRLTIDGVRFGVEVTMVPDGSREQYAQIEEFKDCIRRQCNELGVVLGRVSLRVHGQPTIPNCKKKADRKAIQRALAGMRQAFDAGEEYLFPTSDFRNSIVFERIGFDDETSVTLSAIVSTEWEPKTREMVTQRIQEACAEKLSKLGNKGFPASECILLLFSDYGFSETNEVVEDTVSLATFRHFHSVAWVPGFRERDNRLRPDLPGRYCEFLWSRNEQWWPA